MRSRHSRRHGSRSTCRRTHWSVAEAEAVGPDQWPGSSLYLQRRKTGTGTRKTHDASDSPLLKTYREKHERIRSVEMCRRLIRKMSAEWDAIWRSRRDQFQIRVLHERRKIQARRRRIQARSSSRLPEINGPSTQMRAGRALVSTERPTRCKMRPSRDRHRHPSACPRDS